MNLVQFTVLMVATLFGYLAYENAKESHRHAHEIACALSYQPLCIFHEAQP